MTRPRQPRSCLARLQRRPIDVEAEKYTGWREQGLLVVSADDRRLTWPERELVKQLGTKLYGRRKTAGGAS